MLSGKDHVYGPPTSFVGIAAFACKALTKSWTIARAGLKYDLRWMRMVIPSLETKRLWLRPLTIGDADQIQTHFPHWEIVRLMSDIPWPYPPNGASAWCLDAALPQIERGEAWHWTLRVKDAPQQVIGAISLMTAENNNRSVWVGLPWQRQGFASEAAEAATDFWFEVLKYPVLRVPKAVMNLASRRLSEKQRMRVIATEERDHVSGRLLDEIWEISADEWRARLRIATTSLHPKTGLDR